ncbi:MAG: hypothetical protein SGBAC_009543 [Bacillariaceae sp.]
MGITASIFQNDHQPETQQKKDKVPEDVKADWHKAVDKFTKEILDPSYLHLPVRGSTLNASLLYPSDYPDHPGLMPGTHKHLGGAYDPTDGCIYGVPANSKSILCIYKDEEEGEYRMKAIPLPERIQKRQMKFLRGIIAHGYLWAIPAWADSVLCVDIDAYWGRRELSEGQTDYVHLIPLPDGHPKSMRWQWHGAGINIEQTAIYCIPSNTKHVLKVDIATKTTSFIEIEYDKEKYTDFELDCTNKWYGGIVGDDNAIYGIPYRAPGVLRIDSTNDTAKLIGPNYGVSNFFWHGGIKRHGKIYAHPSHADTVLVIDTKEESRGSISELEIHGAENDKTGRTKFKWLGGSVGADGNIYCPACDVSAVLKINPTTDHCETFGYAGEMKNKWQGGTLSTRDNCIYCIPADGVRVCRIATDPSIEGENPVQLLGNLPESKDKWQGAATGLDGSLYFIPENGYRVMKVTPPAQPPKVVDGKLPEDDVKIELL